MPTVFGSNPSEINYDQETNPNYFSLDSDLVSEVYSQETILRSAVWNKVVATDSRLLSKGQLRLYEAMLCAFIQS